MEKGAHSQTAHDPNTAAASGGGGPTREELRRRLRARAKAQREGGGGAAARSAPLDVQGELLRRGLDDADLLNMAGTLSRDPKQALAAVRNLQQNATAADDDEAPPPLPSVAAGASDAIADASDGDDEEAPPS